MLRLIIGRAGTGKTAIIYKEIAERVHAGQKNMILLLPEQYTHEAERELCRTAGDGLSLCAEVLSFTSLSRRVFERCGIRRRLMDGGGRVLCMAVAMHEVSSRLKAYRKYAGQPRMLQQLVRAAGQLQSAGLDAQKLTLEAQESTGLLKDKLEDLAMIMAAYDAARSGSRLDPAEVLTLLAEKIGTVTSPGDTYYIDGFSDFTVPQQEVLRALLLAGTDITVCLTCDEDAGGLFAVPLHTRGVLRRMAESCGVPVEEIKTEPGERTPIGFACDHLFDFTGQTMADPDETITLTQASDIYEECELAAARMAELARQGARWREIAVAVRGFDDYRAILESMCERYGVPMFLSGRGDMLRRSVPLMIASALEAAERGYEYEAMFSMLKTGLMPLTADECDRLENYVLRWGIRGSLWEQPFIGHPNGYNQKETDESRAALEELNALRERIITPLAALKDACAQAGTALDHVRALTDFLVGIDLPDRLTERASRLDSEGRQEAAAEYARVWELVCTALEQFAGVLGDMPMNIRDFRELLCLMLSCYDVMIIPVSLDRVQAGDISGMRRRHIRHLLVLGAADSRLPAPEDGSGVFTQEERAELTGRGLPMGSAEEDYARELGDIYTCLSLPSDSLYISWPGSDGDGGECRPSVIAERIGVLLGTQKKTGDILRARTFSEPAAFSLAVRAAAGGTEQPCLQAKAYFDGLGRGDELTRVIGAARADRGRLSREAVTLLYGRTPAISATGAERFADCRYEYFLKNGLRLRPREQSTFDPRDYGTFIHSILQDVARRALKAGGFPAVTAEQVSGWTDELMDEYIHRELHDFRGKSPRFEYLFRRQRIQLQHITHDTWEELHHSEFKPVILEEDLREFGITGLGEGISLIGRPDRVDGWLKDGRLYLRVIDYKTGQKKFSLTEVCEGKNLQMLLYLYALQHSTAERFRGKELLPAGVLYCRARHDIVSAEYELNDAELSAERAKAGRRSGLLLKDEAVLNAMDPGGNGRFLPPMGGRTGDKNLADADQLQALGEYVVHQLQSVSRELADGSIDADPWRDSGKTPCEFCDYKHVCLFNEEYDSYRERRKLDADEAWNIILGKEESGHE